jgi:hypothetical protein
VFLGVSAGKRVTRVIDSYCVLTDDVVWGATSVGYIECCCIGADVGVGVGVNLVQLWKVKGPLELKRQMDAMVVITEYRTLTGTEY